jgi:hypothetical protein
MMGHSGNVPGAISAEDVPKALENLQDAIEKLTADLSLKPSSEETEQEDWQEKPVTLAHRALPLIELLSASAKANCYVMWERN